MQTGQKYLNDLVMKIDNDSSLGTKEKGKKTEELKNVEQWLYKGLNQYDNDITSALDCFKQGYLMEPNY